MANNTRILNITRGYTLKHKQALRAIEACSAAWVEFGVSVRDLTLKESIAKRNEQAKMREPLEFAELPGLIFRPAANTPNQAHSCRVLIMQANKFAAEMS